MSSNDGAERVANGAALLGLPFILAAWVFPWWRVGIFAEAYGPIQWVLLGMGFLSEGLSAGNFLALGVAFFAILAFVAFLGVTGFAVWMAYQIFRFSGMVDVGGSLRAFVSGMAGSLLLPFFALEFLGLYRGEGSLSFLLFIAPAEGLYTGIVSFILVGAATVYHGIYS